MNSDELTKEDQIISNHAVEIKWLSQKLQESEKMEKINQELYHGVDKELIVLKYKRRQDACFESMYLVAIIVSCGLISFSWCIPDKIFKLVCLILGLILMLVAIGTKVSEFKCTNKDE